MCSCLSGCLCVCVFVCSCLLFGWLSLLSSCVSLFLCVFVCLCVCVFCLRLCVGSRCCCLVSVCCCLSAASVLVCLFLGWLLLLVSWFCALCVCLLGWLLLLSCVFVWFVVLQSCACCLFPCSICFCCCLSFFSGVCVVVVSLCFCGVFLFRGWGFTQSHSKMFCELDVVGVCVSARAAGQACSSSLGDWCGCGMNALLATGLLTAISDSKAICVLCKWAVDDWCSLRFCGDQLGRAATGWCERGRCSERLVCC